MLSDKLRSDGREPNPNLVLSPVYGYVSGGHTGGLATTAYRMSFSSGVTVTNSVSKLSVNRYWVTGCSDKICYGYFNGGYSTACTVTVDRILFSSGVTSANSVSNLSVARYPGCSLSDGNLHGYMMSGVLQSSIGTLSTDRISFSTGITALNTVSNVSVKGRGFVSISDLMNGYGYSCGGNRTNLTDRILYSTGVNASNTVSKPSTDRQNLGGAFCDGVCYGYMLGGNTGTTYYVNGDRMLLSSGVNSSNTVSNLTTKRRSGACFANASYGYISGGDTGGLTASCERVLFSTGVCSANTVGNLTTATAYLAGLADYSV